MNRTHEAASMRRGYVRLPDGTSVECWLRDETWNGFAIPYFSLDDMPELLSMLRSKLGTEHVRFDGRVVSVGFDEERAEEFARGHDGLWCVGGWQWAWLPACDDCGAALENDGDGALVCGKRCCDG